jgi:hypothetical protein
MVSRLALIMLLFLVVVSSRSQKVNICAVPVRRSLRLADRTRENEMLLKSFSLSSALAPPAGHQMASPPNRDPRFWEEDAGALGRNYGYGLAAEEAAALSKELVATLLHEAFISSFRPQKRVTADRMPFCLHLSIAPTTVEEDSPLQTSGVVLRPGLLEERICPLGTETTHALQRIAGGVVGY